MRTEDDDEVWLDVGRRVQLPGDRLLVDQLTWRHRCGGGGEGLATVGGFVDDDRAGSLGDVRVGVSAGCSPDAVRRAGSSATGRRPPPRRR